MFSSLRSRFVPILIIVLLSSTLIASAATTLNVTETLGPDAQDGRIFRDGVPSDCSGKAYPGIFNETTSYFYDMYGAYGPLTETTCITINFDPNAGGTPCDTNAHASAYLNSYDPNNQGVNYLGDVGSSVTQPFSFEVPAGESFVIVVTNTAEEAACTYSFTSTPFSVVEDAPVVVEPQPGPDMVYIPSTAVVGIVVTETHAYWMPDTSAVTDIVLAAGKTYWVYGVDSTSQFYRVMMSGKFFWVPVDTMGPNPDSVWNSHPLPTTVINTTATGGAVD